MSAAVRVTALALWVTVGGCLADLSFERSAGAFCDRNDACAGGNYCDLENQRCTPLIRQGFECSEPYQCETGFCADGLCCDGPCNVACLTCAAPDALGECAVQQAGSDPRGDCPGTAACGEEGFCQGAPKWAVRFGGTGDDRAVDLAFDLEGNIVAVGTFSGTIAWGDEESTSFGGDDVFVVKLDGTDGELLFHATFGSAGNDRVAGVEINESCDIIIAGDFDAQLDLLGTVLVAGGTRDGYVAALARGLAGPCDHLAAAAWAEPITGAGRAAVHGLSVAPSGHIALIGDFDGALDFTTFPTITHMSVTAWAASLMPNGTWLWRHALGDDVATQRGVAVASDSTGHVLIAVDATGSVDFGGANGMAVVSASDVDLLVAKLDPDDGTAVWFFPYDGDADQRGSAMAVDDADNPWFTGTFVDEVNVPGNGELDATAAIDGFYVKLTPDGGHVGSGPLSGPFDDEPRAVTIDDREQAIIVGGFDLALALEGVGALDSHGDRDMFLLSLAPDASLEWGVPFGGALADQALAVVVEPSPAGTTARGDVFAAGSFQGEVELGADELHALGRSDAFVARFAR